MISGVAIFEIFQTCGAAIVQIILRVSLTLVFLALNSMLSNGPYKFVPSRIIVMEPAKKNSNFNA